MVNGGCYETEFREWKMVWLKLSKDINEHLN